jgi:predicted aldo/keto reductase-like oxidoreductase
MSEIDRREFLRRSAMAGAALGLMPLAAGAATNPRRVTLGRTGLSVSDIGFGGSRIGDDEATVRHAFERGVNYFDTAEGYGGGASETTIGNALHDVRDRVLIASKGQFSARTSRADMLAALEGSLGRLRTDHVDVYFNHAVNDVDVIANPEWPEFVAIAKQQGKIRFSGMSGHGGRLVDCVNHAVDHDVADVLLLGYNFGQDPSFVQRFTASMDFVAVQPKLPKAMQKARAKGVGVIAMKTLRGARLNDMRPHEKPGGTFAQAAFRWVLTGPYAHSLIVTMRSATQIDEYLVASGSGAPSADDAALLERYERTVGASQCRYGCDACLAACPAGVPIAEVLRTRMYAEDYGDLELARGDYAQLGGAASPCAGCTHQACASACPHGLAIPELTSRTHDLLQGGRT